MPIGWTVSVALLWPKGRQDVSIVALPLVEECDLEELFEQMREPESVRRAAFTPPNSDDRDAFDAHMARLRSSPEIILRAVTSDGRLTAAGQLHRRRPHRGHLLDRSPGQGRAVLGA